MKTYRNLFFKLLRYSGLPMLFREVLQRHKVTIVMLHDPAPEMAEQTFRYLSRHYNIVGLNTFLDACRRGDASSLPPKAMIITLDDGHRHNYDLLPVIKRMNIPVTIFLCAGIIDTNRHYWFKVIHPTLSKQELKSIPYGKKLHLLAETGFFREMEYATPQALNKAQIEAMQPYVNFQAHTAFHPCLPQCTDEEAREEIFSSKQILEEQFNLPINAMAYPNGDYSLRDIGIVREAGYSCAITVDYGFNTIYTDPYRFRRLSIDDMDNIDAVCVKASGVWTRLLTWIGKRRAVRLFEPVAAVPGKKTGAVSQLTSFVLLTLMDPVSLLVDAACV